MRTATPTGTAASGRPRRRRTRVVRRYQDERGSRELVARPAAHGSLLLVDRDSRGGGDERLVAHLAADEPSVNASIAARLFLAAEPSRRRCRPLRREDELRSPFDPAADDACQEQPDRSVFRLRLVPCSFSIPAIRWARPAQGRPTGWEPVSLREVIAAEERYEPFCELTRRALARHDADPRVSSTVLRTELGRVLDSSIVLNRALREAVLALVAGGTTSMSEIAMRCGRCKRDSKGNTTGETSWLARRIGLLAEGGQQRPTRWVHSDVLALIAREGLGIAPREVELG